MPTLDQWLLLIWLFNGMAMSVTYIIYLTIYDFLDEKRTWATWVGTALWLLFLLPCAVMAWWVAFNITFFPSWAFTR